jgi:hypothetical protein
MGGLFQAFSTHYFTKARYFPVYYLAGGLWGYIAWGHPGAAGGQNQVCQAAVSPVGQGRGYLCRFIWNQVRLDGLDAPLMQPGT